MIDLEVNVDVPRGLSVREAFAWVLDWAANHDKSLLIKIEADAETESIPEAQSK